jgi:hypothetical protein
MCVQAEICARIWMRSEKLACRLREVRSMLSSHLQHDNQSTFLPAVLDASSHESDAGEHHSHNAGPSLHGTFGSSKDLAHLVIAPRTSDSDILAAEALRRSMARRESSWGVHKAATALRGLRGWSAVTERDSEGVAADESVSISKELLKDAGKLGCSHL